MSEQDFHEPVAKRARRRPPCAEAAPSRLWVPHDDEAPLNEHFAEARAGAASPEYARWRAQRRKQEREARKAWEESHERQLRDAPESERKRRVPPACGKISYRGQRYFDRTPAVLEDEHQPPEDEHQLISDWFLVGPHAHIDEARPREQDVKATKAKRCPRCGGKNLASARARYGDRYVGSDPRQPELKTRKRDPELVRKGESRDFAPGSTRGRKGVERFLPQYREPLLSLNGRSKYASSRLAVDHWDGWDAPRDWPNPCVLCGGTGSAPQLDWPWQTGPRLSSHQGYEVDDEETLMAELVESEREDEHDPARSDKPELVGLEEVAAEDEEPEPVHFRHSGVITTDGHAGTDVRPRTGTAGVRRLAAPPMPELLSDARYRYVRALLFDEPSESTRTSYLLLPWIVCDECAPKRRTLATAREAWACRGQRICTECMRKETNRDYATAAVLRERFSERDDMLRRIGVAATAKELNLHPDTIRRGGALQEAKAYQEALTLALAARGDSERAIVAELRELGLKSSKTTVNRLERVKAKYALAPMLERGLARAKAQAAAWHSIVPLDLLALEIRQELVGAAADETFPPIVRTLINPDASASALADAAEVASPADIALARELLDRLIADETRHLVEVNERMLALVA